MAGRIHVAVFDLVTSVGGVQKVMAAALPGLARSMDVTVIDLYANAEYRELMGRAGLPVISLGPAPERKYIGGKGTAGRAWRVLKRVPWLAARMIRLRRWVREARPDIVYFNQKPSALWFGRVVPRSAGLVYHCHGFGSAAEVGRTFARLLRRRFDRVLAVSKITARFLAEAGLGPDQIAVVYNAVDVEGLQQQAAQPGPDMPQRRAGEVVFVHVAAIAPHKGQDIAIRALSKLPAGAGAQLWFCGDVGQGGDRQYLDDLKRLVDEQGLAERVHFLGWREDVPRLMEAADVCILPSRYHHESFGMVLAEAMALGKPCIGSRRGGIPEVIEVGVTGLLCEPDTESLASAMRKMVESEVLRASMGAAGRRRVEEVFNLGRQSDEIREVVRFVIGAARRET
ncbi:MAG TPA: glycosyltransferase [Phycisphaerae bacterium]|nr:glycosyltransferase [Phycisphaerae bacterium]